MSERQRGVSYTKTDELLWKLTDEELATATGNIRPAAGQKGPDGSPCLLWRGYVQPAGGPWVTIRGRRVSVRRASLFRATGRLGHRCVLLCQNESCTNPRHLAWTS